MMVEDGLIIIIIISDYLILWRDKFNSRDNQIRELERV